VQQGLQPARHPTAHVNGRIDQHQGLHPLRIAQGGQKSNGAAGRIAHQHGFFEAQIVHEGHRQIGLGFQAVGILTRPPAGQGPLCQAKGRAVESNDRRPFCQRSHDVAPGKEAGSKAMQQQQHTLSLPGPFVMDLQAIDLDKAAVRIGQILGRDRVP
jgi:hypothetical protein